MYRTLHLKFVLLVGILLVSSCAPTTPTPIPPVTDEEFEVAVKQAHSTLDIVRRALLSPKPSYTFIGLKIRVYGKSTYEDIWTEPVDYYNGVFITHMVEGVTIQTGFHPDSFVHVPLEDVLDWMIVEDGGNLIGGYTIRLSYEHMTPDEKEEFLKITGYVIK